MTKALALRAGVLAAGVALVAAACSDPSPPASTASPARYVVFAYVPTAGEGGALKVLDRNGRYAVLRPPAAARSALPLPAPDGRHAAVPDLSGLRRDDGRIAVIDTATGRVTWIRTPVAPATLSWSPDSRRIAVLGRTGPGPAPVVSVDVTTGRASVLSLSPPPGRRLTASTVLFGPRGTGLVVPYGSADLSTPDGRLAFYTPRGRLVRWLRVDGSPVGSRPWSPSGRMLTLLADPPRSGGPAQIVALDARTGRVAGRFAVDGLPVGWLDETHLAVAAGAAGGAAIDSVGLDGRGRHRLAALPPDTAAPATVFLVPASGVPPAARRYAF